MSRCAASGARDRLLHRPAILSCPGRAAACNAAAQSRDPCGGIRRRRRLPV